MKYYLSIDIGASSGRHIVGYFKDDKLITDEVYRFKNGVVEENNHLVWNLDKLFNEVKIGIKKALEIYNNIESMSIDTWGVDYCLIKNGREVYPTYAYRDSRTKEIINDVHNMISFDEIYKITGSQFQEFNTIYQLYKDKIDNRLNDVDAYLMIPEYLIYKLTGIMIHEYTNASTTSLLDLNTNNYSFDIINKLGLPKHLFTDLVKPHTFIGDFTSEVRKEVNGNIKVYTCATHDTASAVEAIKAECDYLDGDIYLSSGTWSLLGVCLDKGINTNEAIEANYSNEYGPNYIRFQKNIMGLWIIQGLQKEISINGKEISFPEMVELAKKSTFEKIFDVNDQSFLSALHMKDAINNWFKNHQMSIPNSDADYIYTAYNSLAYSYFEAIKELEKITNKKYQRIIVVGGGAKNTFLNDLIKKHCKIEVIAYPIEATAMGNIYSQISTKRD